MNPNETRSILAVCLMAAFADGAKHERERAEIRRIAESLSPDAQLDLAGLYQEVLLERIDLERAVAGLGSPETRQLAYEMAVCVCDADGVASQAERDFLGRLGAALGMPAREAETVRTEADALAAEAVPQAEPPVHASTMAPEELDRMILNASILNGAIELLPQSVASMAIIPLQMRLVYRVGHCHGFELDRGHITDFLATLGVGLTSQYLEQFGRKLIGGLLRKVGGKLAGGIGSAATGVAFSFATTWAMGHVAKRYYAGGRTLDTATLKSAFEGLLGEARQLQARYQPQIEQQAKTLDAGKIIEMVRKA